MTDEHTRILILGGGFSAISVAKKLGKLAKRHHNIEVAIVSENNYFVFQPMLPEVAAGSIEASHIVNPIRRLCKNVTFHRAKVDKIDTKAKIVTIVGDDIRKQHELHYDELVISLGLSTDMSRIPGMSEHALPMKTLGDAFFLRNEIINKLEMAAIEPDINEKRRLLTFVLVGGGFSGVETAGEIGDMIRKAIKGYSSIERDDIRILLIHAGERILQELSDKLGEFAEKKLTQRGIEVLSNTRVTEVTHDGVQLDNRSPIETYTVICTTGNAPHRVITELPFTNQHGRIDTDPYFQVVKRNANNEITRYVDSIWALGDCAFIPNILSKETSGPKSLCPPTAQFATREGKRCAKNIIAKLKKKPLKPFKFKELGQMAVIGHLTGVAEIFGLRFSGFLAFALWRFVYWLKLPGLYCKSRVALDWLIDAIFPVDITQINTIRTQTMDRSHYQKGSYIFRQGEIPAYFYIIESGEVEIIKENPDGSEFIVALLKEGDSFGEMGLMTQEPRSASIRCATPVGVLKITRSDFRTLTGSYSELRNQLEEKVANIQAQNASIPNKRSTDLLGEKEYKKTLTNLTHDTSATMPGKVVCLPSGCTPEYQKNLEDEYEANPQDTAGIAKLGDCYRAQGRVDEAIVLFQDALMMKPNEFHLLVRLGDAWRRKKEYKKAISYLQKALQQDVTNMYIISSLASCYTALKQYDAAEKLYNLGLRKAPNHPSLLAQFGQCLKEQGNYDQAAAVIKLAKVHNPTNKRLTQLLDEVVNAVDMAKHRSFTHEIAQSLQKNQSPQPRPEQDAVNAMSNTVATQQQQPKIFRSRKSI
ncbi:MAG: FAD-dependent oxidoreductase [bacterium]|nr:FAD-dependent oxidoreductase [bacterium]